MTQVQTLSIKLKEGVSQWMKLNLYLLLCMLIVRLFFFLQVHFRIEVESSQFLSILKGTVFDFYLVCRTVIWLLIPYLLFHCFFPKTTFKVGFGLVIAYVVIAALLTEYFCNLFMPLDHVILVYSPEELKGTATSSAAITAAPFLWFLGTMAVIVGLWFLIRKLHVGFVVASVLLAVALDVTIFVPYKDVVREEWYYKDHASFSLAINQPSYAFVKITDYLADSDGVYYTENNEVGEKVLKAYKKYKKLHPEFELIDPSYPFYRRANDSDVLSPFIEKTKDNLPPNFVFIIVESLGQRLTGVDYPVMSFTPFIDSLKQDGLYWKNCLSTAERTFGALPSLFASAPYGKYGFYTLSKPIPTHNSLFRDMKRNGYNTLFYYGAADEIGRFDRLLKINKLDYIYVPGAQDMDASTFEYLNEYQRWGMDDRELFAYVKEYKKAHPSPRPCLDIIMTLTTHEPFFFEDVKAYEERVEAMVASHPEMSEKERTNITKNLNIFACFLYLDDCVRDFMTFYRTLPEYQNTVFVITGDHRMGPLNNGQPLNKYSVPLLVYSPLIPHPRSMDAVVSHLDIPPTLNAYLHSNYDYQINENCHWLGTSLDTSLVYKNTRKQAFMLNNRDVVDYVDENYVISNNRLFMLDKDLIAHAVQDEAVLNRMKSELADFNTISQFAVQNDHLTPAEYELEVLRYDNYDFESDYNAIFSRYVQEQDGNHFVFLDSTYLYAPLFEQFLITPDKKDLVVDIAFDLQSLDVGRELPVVAIELGSYYMSLKLNSAEDLSLNTGGMEHFHQHFSILNEESEDQKLKIYFFNPSKNRMRYDNIKISVSSVEVE